MTNKLRLIKNGNISCDLDAGKSENNRIAELYNNHNEALVRYLTIRLNSRQDAIEVAQEAYIRLMKLESLETIGFVRAFLFRTATNIAIDRLRQRKRQSLNMETQKTLYSSIEEITPEHSLNAKQTLSRLHAALEDLPPKCRQAFMLYKFRNIGYSEIALQMKLSESMVRKYVARGLVYCAQKTGRNNG